MRSMARAKERKQQAGGLAAHEPLSPSVPLDAPHPSAVLEVTAEEYDALVADLEAPPEPSEALRRTMALHPLPTE